MKKIIFIFAFALLLFSVSFGTVFAMGNSNSRTNHPAVPMQSIGKISPNAAHGMHTAWQRIQNSNGMARHVFAKRFRPVGHPDVVLESVEYEGTCSLFGSHIGDKMTFTFSNDIEKDDKVIVYFLDSQEFKETWGKATYKIDGDELIVTVNNKWTKPRPEVGDYVVDLEGLVDSVGNDVVVPNGGVKIIQTGGECLIETVEVGSKGDTYYSDYKLSYGQDYRLEASGTYRFANWGSYGIADPAWNYRSSTYAPDKEAGWYQQDSGYLQLWVDGEAVEWQPDEFNPSHIYTYDLEGDGSKLDFKILDDNYSDNSGSLKVKIYKVW